MSGSSAAVFVTSAVAVVGLVATTGAAEIAGLLKPPTAVTQSVAASPAATPLAPAESFVKVVGPGASKPTSDRHPTSTSAAGPASERGPAAAGTSCAAGPWQREIEDNLASLDAYDGVIVDGKQSPGDCSIIRAFQDRFGIEPAKGQSDATTADVARRIAASSTPGHLRRCTASQEVTACVDLTLQTTWVVRDGAVVFGPTVVRTGFRGFATPAGGYTINKRTAREWSDPYEIWLPYWQRFVGGIGFHETTTYLHDKARGSHGCVNLLHRDARAMWDQLQMGAKVYTFGRRPGT